MDEEAVWSAHLNNSATLNAYAAAMHQLATRFWPSEQSESLADFPTDEEKTTASGCRIRWIAAALRSYYCAGGRLEKQRRKDARRLARFRTLRPVIIQELEEAHNSQNCDHVRLVEESEGMEKDKTVICTTSEGKEDPPQLKVFDVGSCFNPLQQFRCDQRYQGSLSLAIRYRYLVYRFLEEPYFYFENRMGLLMVYLALLWIRFFCIWIRSQAFQNMDPVPVAFFFMIKRRKIIHRKIC
jgi:hypothetical protein